jgi:hypothetical protein
MLQPREVDVAGRLPPCALDLQLWKAAIDGLVDGGRRIDRLAVAPLRSFQLSQGSLSACWIIASPLARISADRVARMLAIARALPTSLFKAFRSPPEWGAG